MLSDIELMAVQAGALFRHDAQGRLLAVNESGDPLAPRLFLGRTITGNLWRFRHDLPESPVRELEGLLQTEPVASDLALPPICLARVRSALEAHTPIAETWSGPAWRFPDEIGPPPGVTPVTRANADLVRSAFPYLADHLASMRPCMAVIRGGDAVSVCFSARNSAEAAEAGVATVEAFRGRGYAAAVAAAWGIAVRQSGRIPLYSTSWENLASQAVARRLGLILYGVDLSLT